MDGEYLGSPWLRGAGLQLVVRLRLPPRADVLSDAPRFVQDAPVFALVSRRLPAAAAVPRGAVGAPMDV